MFLSVGAVRLDWPVHNLLGEVCLLAEPQRMHPSCHHNGSAVKQLKPSPHDDRSRAESFLSRLVRRLTVQCVSNNLMKCEPAEETKPSEVQHRQQTSYRQETSRSRWYARICSPRPVAYNQLLISSAMAPSDMAPRSKNHQIHSVLKAERLDSKSQSSS